MNDDNQPSLSEPQVLFLLSEDFKPKSICLTYTHSLFQYLTTLMEEEYESLGSNATMTQNAIAGALAGIGEHCLMYPIDSYKASRIGNRVTQRKQNNNTEVNRHRHACKFLQQQVKYHSKTVGVVFTRSSLVLARLMLFTLPHLNTADPSLLVASTILWLRELLVRVLPLLMMR